MIKIKFITIILLLVQSLIYGQNANAASVDNILKSDTIIFELLESGCLHESNEKIVITKITIDKYSVVYSQADGKLTNATITKKDISNFGQCYKSEMIKKHQCISTTSTTLVLKTKNNSVEFNYSGCNEKRTPMFELTKRLKL